jgi:hypothetical protein
LIKSGKVIRIFSDASLVVNLGSADGVEVGAKMTIYAPPVEILDPESGEELGTYHHLKTNVQVEKVHDRFSIVGPVPIRRQVSKSSNAANLFQQFQPEYKTERRHLAVAESQVDPLPGGAAIQVGDPIFVTIPDPPEDHTDEPESGQTESEALATSDDD